MHIFMTRKDLSFYDQVLQAIAILDKKLKFFILTFFTLNPFFSQNIFHL